MKVLVTGGAGFIGSHACKALSQSGFVPIVYDDLSRGHRAAVKWGPLEVGRIADHERLLAVLKKHQPIAVMHFAAFTSVAESVSNPLVYYQNNVGGTLALLASVIRHRPLPIIFSSTAALYGSPQIIPIPETHPLMPSSPYGHSKLMAEQIFRDAAAAHHFPFSALRYFNAAGSDPDGEIGESHDPETHLIPIVIEAALTGKAVKIFGTDYDTPDGTCIRDYIHVSDIADGHVLALKRLLSNGDGGTFNLSNSQGHSVKQVISAVEKAVGRPIRVNVAPRRSGDPDVLIGSSEKARDVLGWRPRRPTLSTQIHDALQWLASQPHRRLIPARVGSQAKPGPLNEGWQTDLAAHAEVAQRLSVDFSGR